MELSNTEVPPTPAQRDRIAALLGREPRGLRAVAVADAEGEPIVIRVASVVDSKPFPTLYWLIGSDLSLQIDRLEATGWIARLQAQVNQSDALQRAMRADHERYRIARERFLTVEEAEYLEQRGMRAALDERGIGGIGESHRIRCLHTWYAAHLVTPNAIGALVDDLLADGEYLAPA
jgi:hypothetical protein